MDKETLQGKLAEYIALYNEIRQRIEGEPRDALAILAEIGKDARMEQIPARLEERLTARRQAKRVVSTLERYKRRLAATRCLANHLSLSLSAGSRDHCDLCPE